MNIVENGRSGEMCSISNDNPEKRFQNPFCLVSLGKIAKVTGGRTKWYMQIHSQTRIISNHLIFFMAFPFNLRHTLNNMNRISNSLASLIFFASLLLLSSCKSPSFINLTLDQYQPKPFWDLYFTD